MSDEQNTVDVGSDESEEETAQADTSTETAVDETSEDTSGETADETDTAPSEAPVADASRTSFIETGRPGDQCTCPDGRTGTVHRFDEGLICIPNADQG
jgi:hypothetical protein